jgi:hypothetical protein
LLLAACLLFTPAVLALTLIYDCTVMDGPCFVASYFMVLWVKPIIYGLFVLSFIGIGIGRARDSGVPLWLATGLILLLFADLRFGISLGFATGRNAALMGFWGEPVGRYFLPAQAVIGTLCVLRSAREAPEPWQVRLGPMSTFAVPGTAVLLAAAIAGALEAAVPYVPLLGSFLLALPLWSTVGAVLSIAVALTPWLLLPIAAQEWRKAGAPGEGSIWHRAVMVVAALLCVAGVLHAITGLRLWIAPDAMRGFREMMAIPLNVLNLVTLIGAFALPALIARMLELGRRPERTSA